MLKIKFILFIKVFLHKNTPKVYHIKRNVIKIPFENTAAIYIKIRFKTSQFENYTQFTDMWYMIVYRKTCNLFMHVIQSAGLTWTSDHLQEAHGPRHCSPDKNVKIKKHI